MDEDVPTTLVVIGERSRLVTFTFKASGTGSVKEVLMRAITETYADVIRSSKYGAYLQLYCMCVCVCRLTCVHVHVRVCVMRHV